MWRRLLPPILRPLTLPTLHITATEDTIRIPGFYSPVNDRLAVFEAVGSPLKALAFLQRVFDGRGEALERWPQTYAALLARWVSRPSR